MGLPGSYLIATNQSYVGNLLELAGGENVYQSSDKEFYQLTQKTCWLRNLT